MRLLLVPLASLAIWAQPATLPLQRPWENVPEVYRTLPYGKLAIPKTLGDWKKQRPGVRETVLRSLGEMPARPKPDVRILATDRKDGYRIEKFTFHNGVDADVPGYLAIPEKYPGRRPAILTMHGHGSSKDNMFGYQPTSQDVAEMLAKKGYVVIGIDNYFNGERRGKGPAGDLEMQALGAHGIYYFVPGILKHFDSEGIMTLIAPRPFLALTGDRDAGSPPEGMKTLEQILNRFYGVYGKPDAFQSIVYAETGHVYTDDMKQKMVAWFDRHL